MHIAVPSLSLVSLVNGAYVSLEASSMYLLNPTLRYQ
jgi:hypothetical protein